MNTQYLSQLPFHTTKELYIPYRMVCNQTRLTFLLLQFPSIKLDCSTQFNLGHPVGQTAVVQGGGWMLTSFGHNGNSQLRNEVHLLNFIHGNPFFTFFLKNLVDILICFLKVRSLYHPTKRIITRKCFNIDGTNLFRYFFTGKLFFV